MGYQANHQHGSAEVPGGSLGSDRKKLEELAIMALSYPALHPLIILSVEIPETAHLLEILILKRHDLGAH